MSSFSESLPDDPDTRLTGKARAKARAEAWRDKQNQRFMAEMRAEREKRLFPGLDEAGRAFVLSRYAEIEERARLEREREEIRDHHEAVVEPIVTTEEEFQSFSLPATTVPLTIAVQDVYAALRQRVGPSISNWFPPETLFRLSHAQFLFYTDPVNYHFLSTASDYKNFEGIVRTIQLNAHYVDDNVEIVPVIDHINPRCITLESIDRFRNIPDSFFQTTLPTVVQYDLSFKRTMKNECGTSDSSIHHAVLPLDYDLEQLHTDGRLVNKVLSYFLSSDSGMFRPRNVLDYLLPPAPYLALINQLPIRELARRERSRVVSAKFPESFKMTFPLNPRVIGEDGYIPLLTSEGEEIEELITMVKSGNLPSGSHSTWDDVSEEDD